MSETIKKPRIRFKGFTEDWEQRKFGDLYTPLTERNAELLPYSRTLSVATMEYKTSGNGAADSSLANYKRLRIGDIAFEGHTSGEFRYGRFVLNDTGDGIMSPRFSALRPLVQMPTKFWKYYIHYEPIMRNVLVNSTKAGTMMNELVVDEFLNSSILVPSEGEQTYIGNALTTFDNLITLHQRKLEKLKLVKKSMLEKMFPKNGSSVPAIRFNGFTDDWEQRKAIDIANYSKGNGYSKGGLTDHGTPIILYGRLYTKYQFAINEVDTFAVFRNGAVYSQGNEVIIPASGETAEDIARASAVEKSGVLLGGDLNILRPFDFMNPLFLALAVSNGEPQKELAKKAQGKSVVHIHNSDIQEVTIAYPSRTEQDRIVNVFRQLDNLITLHQRKVEKLQILKKSMLEKMFV